MPKYKAHLEFTIEAEDEENAYTQLADMLWEGEGRNPDEWDMDELESEMG